jgi:STE24 endopeptidase
MSSIVAQIDAGLSYVASLVDRPEIDYEALVVYSSWAVTAFDLYIQ